MNFVGMVFIFIIVVVSILGITTVTIIKTLKGGKKGSGAAVDDEETRIIQEIHAGLTRMEERVEALETILLEHESAKDVPRPQNPPAD